MFETVTNTPFEREPCRWEEEIEASSTQIDPQSSTPLAPDRRYHEIQKHWSSIGKRNHLYVMKINRWGMIQEISESFAVALGRRPDELAPRSLTEILESESTLEESRMGDVLRKGWGVFEERFAHKEGTPVEALVLAYSIRNTNGEPLSSTSIGIDLTAIKKEEREISLALGHHGTRPVSIDIVHRFDNLMKEVESLLSVSQAKIDPFDELNEFFDRSRGMVQRVIQLTDEVLWKSDKIHHLFRLTSYIQSLSERSGRRVPSIPRIVSSAP